MKTYINSNINWVFENLHEKLCFPNLKEKYSEFVWSQRTSWRGIYPRKENRLTLDVINGVDGYHQDISFSPGMKEIGTL